MTNVGSDERMRTNEQSSNFVQYFQSQKASYRSKHWLQLVPILCKAENVLGGHRVLNPGSRCAQHDGAPQSGSWQLESPGSGHF